MAEEQRVTEEMRANASMIGWSPKEKFVEHGGDPANWVDADEYLKRGETLLPLAKENNRRLMETNRQLEARLRQMQTTIDSFQETVKELEQFHTEDKKRAVERARERLKVELKAAREAGDVDAEAAIIDAMAQQAAPSTTTKKTETAAPKEDPVFQSWLLENGWFETDKKMRGIAIAVAQEMRAEGDARVGISFYNDVTKRTKEFFAQRNGTRQPTGDKTEGGSGGGGGTTGSGSKGKGFAQLPPDAKEACDKQGRKFVGKPGYKTLDDWRSYYATKYWENEA